MPFVDAEERGFIPRCGMELSLEDSSERPPESLVKNSGAAIPSVNWLINAVNHALSQGVCGSRVGDGRGLVACRGHGSSRWAMSVP